MFGRRGKKQDQAFTRIPDQVSLFSISSLKKKKLIHMGEQRQNIPLIFDLFSSLANLLDCVEGLIIPRPTIYLVALSV